ncbi:MAG TPA: hypothetical protein PKL31_17125 [Fulvivirga sp.]|nr:hypothetical protein [Fulvivirga sp.]
MKTSEKFFLIGVCLVFGVHFSFTFLKRIKKNDFGKNDDLVEVKANISLIRNDISKFTTLGYIYEDELNFKELAHYYQARYFLSPTNLSLNIQKQDTLLFFPKGNKHYSKESINKLFDGKYSLLKSYENKIFLLKNE